MKEVSSGPIDSLPLVKDTDLRSFNLSGQATISSNIVKLVIGQVCLEFRREDLLDIAVPEGRDLSTDRLIPACLQIQRGAALLDAYPSDIFTGLTDRIDRPFTVAVGAGNVRRPSDGRFTTLERDFLRHTGLAAATS